MDDADVGAAIGGQVPLQDLAIELVHLETVDHALGYPLAGDARVPSDIGADVDETVGLLKHLHEKEGNRLLVNPTAFESREKPVPRVGLLGTKIQLHLPHIDMEPVDGAVGPVERHFLQDVLKGGQAGAMIEAPQHALQTDRPGRRFDARLDVHARPHAFPRRGAASFRVRGESQVHRNASTQEP